ncbi:site-specific integrase [Clostridia bacterium]|nr:site-specific integrase [Clostridia bacterium]
MRTGTNIYKRKDGRWEARYFKEYKLDGTIKYGSLYAPTYTEVKQKLEAFRKNPNNVKTNKNHILFSEVCNKWLAHIKIKVKSSTYAKYYFIVSRHIIPEIGTFKLFQINQKIIREFIQQKSENGRISDQGNLSAKTVKDIFTIIKSILEFAKKEYGLTDFKLESNLSKTTQKRVEVLTKEEQTEFITYLITSTNESKLGVLISLFTGIRIGELCALQWQDIDFHSGILKIRRTIQRILNPDQTNGKKTMVIIDTPKTQNSIRDIPLPDFLLTILKKQTKGKIANSYVISNDSSKYIEPRTMQNQFKRHLTQANIQDIHFHALRHTFATNAIENGFDIKSLSEILGHSSVNITLEKYVHSSMDQKRLQMQKLQVLLA